MSSDSSTDVRSSRCSNAWITTDRPAAAAAASAGGGDTAAAMYMRDWLMDGFHGHSNINSHLS